MPIRQSRRLACWLAISLLAHGGALWFRGQPAPARQEVAPRLSLLLRSTAPPPAVPTRRDQPLETGRRPVIAASRPAAATAPTDERRATIAEAPAPPINGRVLLEQAKSTLAGESRQRMLDPMFAPAAGNAARASPLARATARPVAGEKMLGDGVLQLTTADGKVHCLQRPPEIASRDIPGAVFAIPVTCPF